MACHRPNNNGFVRTNVAFRVLWGEHRSQHASPTRRHLAYYCGLIRSGVWFRDQVLDCPLSPNSVRCLVPGPGSRLPTLASYSLFGDAGFVEGDCCGRERGGSGLRCRVGCGKEFPRVKTPPHMSDIICAYYVYIYYLGKTPLRVQAQTPPGASCPDMT